MENVNSQYKITNKRRIVKRKECEHDLKDFIESFFISVRQGIDKYQHNVLPLFDPTARVRGDNAMLLNKCIVEAVQNTFKDKWIYGKYGRFILRLNSYILLFKKLNNKNMPMNTPTRLVNQILCQQQTSLFNTDAFMGVNEPVLFVGYNMDKFGVITDIKIVFIDEGIVKWRISENENNILSSNANNIEPLNLQKTDVKVKKQKKTAQAKLNK